MTEHNHTYAAVVTLLDANGEMITRNELDEPIGMDRATVERVARDIVLPSRPEAAAVRYVQHGPDAFSVLVVRQ